MNSMLFSRPSLLLPRRLTRRCLLPLVVTFAFPPAPLWAETVTVAGASGTPGVPFTVSGLANGGDGGPGQSALASALTPGESVNSATAYGGWGGNGGAGNPANGYGGDGGDGCSSTAIAEANRVSTGGNVSAAATAMDGRRGDFGGGGLGGGSTGNGGTLTATASAVTTGGSATSFAAADGKSMGSGAAIASANGSNSSAAPVMVTAQALAGYGRSSSRFNGGPGPIATLGAVHGTSTGDGPVQVIASIGGGTGGNGLDSGGNGAAASLTNAATGRTSGVLDLRQSVSGGPGGDGRDFGGNGGAAAALFTVTDTEASSLKISNQADGGPGGASPSGVGGIPGTAVAELHTSATGHIEAAVFATGGNGANFVGQATSGGAATVNPSSAISSGTGRTVSLGAYQRGGGGGGYGSPTGGDGADSIMTTLVSGSSPGGTLALQQWAEGGRGGDVNSGSGGEGGDAVSNLNLVHSGEALLDVKVDAAGGRGGWGQSRKRGGHAAAAGAVQDDKHVNLAVTAKGSDGSSGGDAVATASAISTGAGNVNVSALATAGNLNASGIPGLSGIGTITAYGESGSGTVIVTGDAATGGGHIGGDPAPSLGTTDGRSIVLNNAVSGRTSGTLKLYQTARAGQGTIDSSSSTATAGVGGDAGSTLVMPGGNPGGGALEGYAIAYGGNSSFSLATQNPGVPGNVAAACDLHNAGDVLARAVADPGVVFFQGLQPSPPVTGNANATANAVSSKPFSSASASAAGGSVPDGGALNVRSETLGGIITRLRTSASAPVSRSSSVSAACGVGTAQYTAGNLNVLGLPPSLPPLQVNAAAALAGMKNLAQFSFGGGYATASASVTLNTSGFPEGVTLALLSGSVHDTSNALSSIHFTVARGGTPLVSQTFTDWTALSSYFTDHVLYLGSAASLNGEEITITFTTTGGGGDSSVNASMVLAAKTAYQLWSEGESLPFWQLSSSDNDGDGESNLLEYAFNTDPYDGSQGSTLPVETLADRVRIHFTRRRGDTAGLGYNMEVSATLNGPPSWQPMASPWTITTTPVDSIMETVTCELPAALAPPRVFVRMNVSLE